MKYWIGGIALMFSVLAQQVWAQVQIGYVDGIRIENDTRRAYDISESLRKEFSAREAEVRGMEAKVKALQAQLPNAPAGRERELKEREFQTMAQRLEQLGRAFLDDVERRKSEERRKYFSEVTTIVSKIAEARKLDLVVQEAVFASKSVDITEQVVKALGGPAPRPAGK
ncbi:MAG: OmpH family outer membrane protein [Betaproteobacteria bacterium]|nr:OmpH family outer membrane protein [Betaproteobacteria bacterium]